MFLLLLTSAIVLFVVHYLVKFTYWKRRNIPGPTPLPFIGNTAASFSKDLRDVELERKEKYGSVFGIYMGTIPFLVVSDPEICKIVTIKEAKNFTDINTFKINQRFFKDSFITRKGQEWKNGRNLVTPCFTTKKIKEIYPQIKKSANPYFENIDNLIEQGKNDEVDLKKFAKGFSLDVVGKFVFAFDLNPAKDNDNPFVINARNVTDFKFWKMAIFNLLPNKIIEAIDLQILNPDALDYMGDLIKALTKQRRQNKDIYYNDFLDMIIRKIDENNLDVTQDQIIAHCIIFFFAGIETVAMTIANTFLNVSQPEYVHYQEELYEELTKLYPDGEIEYDRLNESKLLDAIIKETQRVYPALSRLIRIAENPIEIKGIKMDAGTRVQIAVYALHMDKDFWGEDVNVFRPERFMEEGFRTEDENGIHFMPFGAGPRSCVAERLGLCQVKYLVARTVMKYRVYATDKTKPKYIKNPMALTYNELLLKFERRDKK